MYICLPSKILLHSLYSATVIHCVCRLMLVTDYVCVTFNKIIEEENIIEFNWGTLGVLTLTLTPNP